MDIASLINGAISVFIEIICLMIGATGGINRHSNVDAMSLFFLIPAIVGVVFGILSVIKNAKRKKRLGLAIVGLAISGFALFASLFVGVYLERLHP